MSIKQNGGVFGRNPTFNDVTAWQRVEGGADGNFNALTANSLTVDGVGRFNNNGNENLFIADTANTTRSSLQVSGASNYFNANIDTASHGVFIWRSSNAYTERMRISSSGSVGIGTSSPSTSAMLDVQSTTKGVRFPNMTTTQKNAMADVAGMQVYDTTLGKMCFNTGSAWETITSS